MTDHSTPLTDLDYLGAKATRALRAALRSKRQDKATIIVVIEGSIYTFTPANWIKLSIARARGDQGQYARYGAQFLGPIYANCTAWSPDHHRNELKAIANTLWDNLEHPAALTDDDKQSIQLLYDSIPNEFQPVPSGPTTPGRLFHNPPIAPEYE